MTNYYAVYVPYGDKTQIYAPTKMSALSNFNDAEFYYNDQEPDKLQYTLHKYVYRNDRSRIWLDKALIEFIEE